MQMPSYCSDIKYKHLKNGNLKFELEVFHDELNKYKVLTDSDEEFLANKANALMNQWNEMWNKQEKSKEKKRLAEIKKRNNEKQKQEAIDKANTKTEKAQEELEKLRNILSYSLSIKDRMDIDRLKDHTPFPLPKPTKKVVPQPIFAEIPPEPDSNDSAFIPKYSFVDKLFKSRRKRKTKEAENFFNEIHSIWSNEKNAIEKENDNKHNLHMEKEIKTELAFEKDMKAWEEENKAYIAKQNIKNQLVDEKKKKYLAGEADEVHEYCDMVLSNSKYPEYFPQIYDLQYNPENKIIYLDYQLPSKDDIPKLKSIKYIISSKEFKEQYLSENEINKLFDEVLYQIALRTTYELFDTDDANAIEAVIFNGRVKFTNPATGIEQNSCILSFHANKSEFQQINFKHVQPKACFKKLKGISAPELSSLVPVPPIATLNTNDRRFIDSYSVIEDIGQDENIAMMDWEDFEHLIRELFEKEYVENNSEVKISQSSRDGGIDVVVFDHDPIHGGKTIIQAKRYSYTVGVEFVRDLYGTVIDEGANKGILITTSEFGSDSYNFAKGKPITLLDGHNLLDMLGRHGYKAKIDLAEAKMVLEEKRNKSKKST